jgi:hypothetical protein
MVSPSLYERFELDPWFSLGAGALALACIVVTARQLKRKRSTVAALGLVSSIVTALAWLTNAWAVYDVAPNHISTFGGCSFFGFGAMSGVTAVLALLCLAGGRE